jgi:hypothetical protein
MAKNTPAAPKTRTVKVAVVPSVINALNEIAAQVQALQARQQDIISVVVAQAGHDAQNFRIAGFEGTTISVEIPA